MSRFDQIWKKMDTTQTLLFTACVRNTTEGYSFTLLVCSRGGGGGFRSVQPGGGVRSNCRGGGFRSSCWGGGGSVQPAGEVSILRPLAGGMPLAFTQEDFLVWLCFLSARRSKAIFNFMLFFIILALFYGR